MEWFSQNWVWVLFSAGMIAMHLFGHGGHGGHGSHGGHGGGSGGDHNDPKPKNKNDEQPTSEQEPGHKH